MKPIIFLILILSLSFPVFSQSDTDYYSGDTIPERTHVYFPGGTDSLYKELEHYFFISRADINYSLNETLEADLMLSINKRGEVLATNAQSSNYQLAYELERAFGQLSPFVPATKNGKPVTSYVNIKFLFFIKGNRMEVTDHLYFKAISRGKSNNWIKAGLVAIAVTIMLILWG